MESSVKGTASHTNLSNLAATSDSPGNSTGVMTTGWEEPKNLTDHESLRSSVGGTQRQAHCPAPTCGPALPTEHPRHAVRAASSHPESVRGSCQEMLWRKLGSWGEAGCSLGLGGAASPKPHWPALTEPQHFTCMHRNLPTGELATQWRKSQTLKSNKRVGLFSKGQRKPPFWCSLDLMVNNQGKYRKCSPSSLPCKGRLECPEMVPKP